MSDGALPLSGDLNISGEYPMPLKKDSFAPSDDSSDFKIKLIEAVKSPDRMVFNPGRACKLDSRARPTEARVELDDYLTDKCEIRNREYK